VGGVATEGIHDLLEPVLADRAPRHWLLATPWRLGSQLYVAVLGGPLALAAIATVNAYKLRLPAARQAAIAAGGLVLELALIAFAQLADIGAAGLLPGAIAGIIAYGFARRLQLSGDRVYSYNANGDDTYASMFAAGLAAIVLANLLAAAIWMRS
jgi:hypothetical protein